MEGLGREKWRQGDLKKLKWDWKTDEREWEGTKKFRIHNVTVEFSGEILDGPWAGANKICHHFSVREAALNRFLHIPLPSSRTQAYTMWSVRKRGNNKYRWVILAQDHLKSVKYATKKKSPSCFWVSFLYSVRAILMFICVCVCTHCYICMHMRIQPPGSSCFPQLLIDKGWMTVIRQAEVANS